MLIIIGLVSTCNNHLVRGSPVTTVVNILCSNVEYDFYDPYGSSVNYVLTDVGIHTPTVDPPPYEYYSISPWASNVAYGYGACNGFLSESDCHDCLSTAFVTVIGSCQQNTGAQVQLVDCVIRYENYPFQEKYM